MPRTFRCANVAIVTSCLSCNDWATLKHTGLPPPIDSKVGCTIVIFGIFLCIYLAIFRWILKRLRTWFVADLKVRLSNAFHSLDEGFYPCARAWRSPVGVDNCFILLFRVFFIISSLSEQLPSVIYPHKQLKLPKRHAFSGLRFPVEGNPISYQSSILTQQSEA